MPEKNNTRVLEIAQGLLDGKRPCDIAREAGGTPQYVAMAKRWLWAFKELGAIKEKKTKP
jgi:hypothetical protein